LKGVSIFTVLEVFQIGIGILVP